MFVLISLSFSGCDDSAVSGVSVQDATEAEFYAESAYLTGALVKMGFSYPGIAYTNKGSGTYTFTYTSYDLSTLSDKYTSLSGTIDYKADNLIFDLTFAGGPVVTLYLVVDDNGAKELEVNGYDMLGDITITVTH